jgi:hypothetical protein
LRLRITDTYGNIEGSFVSLCITISVFGMIILGLFVDSVTTRLEKLGGTIVTAYIGQFTVWLAYKSVKSFSKEAILPTGGPTNLEVK